METIEEKTIASLLAGMRGAHAEFVAGYALGTVSAVWPPKDEVERRLAASVIDAAMKYIRREDQSGS